MPSSRSWGDVREKRASQVGNLAVCELRPRPMSVRKVLTSGTKGVGDGIIGALLACWCACRVWMVWWMVVLGRVRRRRAVRNCDVFMIWFGGIAWSVDGDGGRGHTCIARDVPVDYHARTKRRKDNAFLTCKVSPKKR